MCGTNKDMIIFLDSLVRAYGSSEGGKDIRSQIALEKCATFRLAQSERAESPSRAPQHPRRRRYEPGDCEKRSRAVSRAHSSCHYHFGCAGSIGDPKSFARRALLRRARRTDRRFPGRVSIVSRRRRCGKHGRDTQRERVRRLPHGRRNLRDSQESGRDRMRLRGSKSRCTFAEVFRRGTADASRRSPAMNLTLDPKS